MIFHFIMALIIFSQFQFIPFFENDDYNETITIFIKKTIIVDKNGNGDYLTIQKAIIGSSENDIIQVNDGIYYENITIKKDVILNGNSSSTVVIQGNSIGIGINVESRSVKISNFSILNFNIGISCTNKSNIEIDNVSISNIYYDTYYLHSGCAIVMADSMNISIKDCSFTESYYGVKILNKMKSQNVFIFNNNFTNVTYGCYISCNYINNSDYNKNTVIIQSNNIVNVYQGIMCEGSSCFNIINNKYYVYFW